MGSLIIVKYKYKMAEGQFMLYIRKAVSNPMLGRKQFVRELPLPS